MNRSKKKLWLISGIIAALLLGYFVIVPGVLYLLSWNPKTKGVSSHSRSIDEAKERDVFLFEYEPIPNRITINGREFRVNEVWVEKGWAYGSFRKQTLIQGESYEDFPELKGYPHIYQICIQADGLQDYDTGVDNVQAWTLNVDSIGERGFYRSDENILVTKAILDTPHNREVFIIRRGKYPSGKDTLGFLTLQRKR